jgi:hypothetical protein
VSIISGSFSGSTPKERIKKINKKLYQHEPATRKDMHLEIILS